MNLFYFSPLASLTKTSKKRLLKDVNFSLKETADQKSKIEKMIADGKDEYDIKKQKEVLQEYEDGIPDSIGRLQDGLMDFEDLIEEVAEEESVKDSPMLEEAKALVEEMKAKVEEMTS